MFVLRQLPTVRLGQTLVRCRRKTRASHSLCLSLFVNRSAGDATFRSSLFCLKLDVMSKEAVRTRFSFSFVRSCLALASQERY